MQSKKLPVVMIPALNCDERLFTTQIKALQELGHEVLVIDITKAETIQQLAKDINAQVDAKFGAGSEFHVAGLSMGGYTILEMLKQEQESGVKRIKKVALMNTNAHADDEKMIKKRTNRIGDLLNHGLKALKEAAEELWPSMVKKGRETNTELTKTYNDMVNVTGVEGLKNELKQVMSRSDYLAEGVVAKIDNEVLIIAGMDDQRSDVKVHKDILRAINKNKEGPATLVVLNDCGHFSTMEQPGETARLLTDFFSKEKLQGVNYPTYNSCRFNVYRDHGHTGGMAL